jgi:hypothetical protein
MNPGAYQVVRPVADLEVRPLMQRVYLWMTFGLLVTAVVSLLTVVTPPLQALLSAGWPVWVAFLLQLVAVIALSAAVHRLSAEVAALIFTAYAALVGFTLSGILFIYTLNSIAVAFLSASALFGMMTLVGFVTKIDLTRLGTILFFGLLALLVAVVINLFLGSTLLELIISLAGVAIFTGLTAVDTQKIVRMSQDPRMERPDAPLGQLAIRGALTLYLDFLNLFLFLLRLLGRRR